MRKSILALLTTFFLIVGTNLFGQASDTLKTIPMTTERVYEKPVDNGDGTATYKKVVYTIHVGPRGGRYILKGERKIYIPRIKE